ncbi:MAG: cyclic nucleotide-binding domain-containing protein [Methylococcaceae bacterium]
MIIPKKIQTMLPVIDIKPKTIVFREGGEDHRMFLVLEGTVKLYKKRNEEEVEVGAIYKNQFFGEMEMYTSKPRSSSAVALTDTKLVVIRTPNELEQLATDNPWLSEKMMTTMVERLASANVLLVQKRAIEPITQSPDFVVDEEDKTIRRVDIPINEVLKSN